MTAQLKVYEDSGCASETLIRYENTSGTPLEGASVIESPSQGGGNAPPDELTLNFSYDTGNAHWDCDVTRKDGTSYHVDSVITNGHDINHVVPGVTLNIASLITSQTYQAKVYIGWNPGILVAGSMSSNKHLWVKNVGDADGYDARIRVLPDGDFTNVAGTPIRAISETNYLQTTAIGTYNIKVKADTSKVDVSYEGNSPVEKTIVADGATENELATGLSVVFNSGVAEDDEADIFISDGKTRVQIAPDISGTPGSFGTADVVLGNMDIDEVKAFWVRIATQAGDSPSGNPRHANLQARITTI
jgi:hypothetical protein